MGAFRGVFHFGRSTVAKSWSIATRLNRHQREENGREQTLQPAAEKATDEASPYNRSIEGIETITTEDVFLVEGSKTKQSQVRARRALNARLRKPDVGDCSDGAH